MAANANLNGKRLPYPLKPANTTANTIYTQSGVRAATLEGVHIATTGAANVTLWYNDGTTDYLLMDAVVMAANTRLTEAFGGCGIPLANGYLVKVMTSSSSNATFVAIVNEEGGNV